MFGIDNWPTNIVDYSAKKWVTEIVLRKHICKYKGQYMFQKRSNEKLVIYSTFATEITSYLWLWLI